ncbi:hypothetical protein [Micromonospora sp. NPDC005652]|uniref:hypothetical protein n=1 Tax=Micromonospora sp. NPDC005652 TaxID=3157046 RepID=UPI003406A589
MSKARAAAKPATGESTRLRCGCPRQEVVDAGRHRRGCTAASYPTGCDSLDCFGDCLVTDQHCDGEDGNG